jgi:hypothetical protein
MGLPAVRHPSPSGSTQPAPEGLRFPVIWAETGQVGTLLIPLEAWRGLAYSYQAAGAPFDENPTHSWIYVWQGHYFEPYLRIEPHYPSIIGSLAWTVWWAWLPSMYAAVIFHAVTTADTTPMTGSQFLAVFIPMMCLLCGLVHYVRWLGRRPK